MKQIDYSITLVVGSDNESIISENKKHINRFIKSKKSDNKDYRVLIVDFKNKYKGTKVAIEDLPNFKNKTCIIGSSEMSNSEKISLLESVCYNYKNGLLIIDNFNEIKSEKVNHLSPVISMLITNRNPKRDCIIGFEDIDSVTSRFIQSSDYIRLHNLKSFNKDKLPNPEFFEIAKYIINDKYQYSPFSKNIILSLPENKIFGCDEKRYIQGIKDYMYDKLCEIQNLKQLNQFNKCIIGDKYFLNQKHIPISNVNRLY